MDRRRFDVYMSTELADQFESVSANTGLTRVEIFRRAMALYKCVKEIEKNKGRILIQENDGTLRKLIIV